MAETVLIILLAIGAYAGSLYLWPFRPCIRCGGTGRNKGSSRRRFGECRRCKGSGHRRRLGARTIHRGAVSLADKARARKGGK
jgi:hypothetical protein